MPLEAHTTTAIAVAVELPMNLDRNPSPRSKLKHKLIRNKLVASDVSPTFGFRCPSPFYRCLLLGHLI